MPIPRNREPVGPDVHIPVVAEQLGKELTGTVLDKLTVKQRRFVEEYPKDLNATQAAIRAGYSKHSAGDIGYENLHKIEVVDALAAIMAQRSKSTGLDRAWVLAQLADTHEKVKDNRTVGATMARLKCLELIGRHVDVRAFRLGLGFSPDGDGSLESDIWDLSLLDDEEFETFERLLAKVTVIKPHSGGTGATQPGAGPEADSGASGGNPGGV